jgi:hypothetical protein
MMAAATYVRLADCSIIAVSNSCILVEYNGKRYWFNKNQVKDHESYQYGNNGVVIWLEYEIASEDGLI